MSDQLLLELFVMVAMLVGLAAYISHTPRPYIGMVVRFNHDGQLRWVINVTDQDITWSDDTTTPITSQHEFSQVNDYIVYPADTEIGVGEATADILLSEKLIITTEFTGWKAYNTHGGEHAAVGFVIVNNKIGKTVMTSFGYSAGDTIGKLWEYTRKAIFDCKRYYHYTS